MREPSYDLVKVVGLLGIVIAHTGPPDVLFQARNFGVPTMAIIAGAVFALSQARRPLAVGAYLRRRVVQLVVPVWTFLLITLPTLHLIAWARGETRELVWDPLYRSAFLLNGPYGNPWVTRVFLLCALSGPLWLALRRRFPSPRAGLALLAVLYLGYEGLCWAWDVHGGGASWATRMALQDVVLFGIGYSLCFALGVRLADLSDRTRLAVAGVLTAGLVLFFLQRGAWIGTQRWKYPPRFPYLAYALACGLVMLVAARRYEPLRRLGRSWVVRTASSASLWFYLWHGFWLLAWYQLDWPSDFLVRFPGNVVLSFLTLLVQQAVLRRILERDLGARTRWWLTTMFAVR